MVCFRIAEDLEDGLRARVAEVRSRKSVPDLIRWQALSASVPLAEWSPENPVQLSEAPLPI